MSNVAIDLTKTVKEIITTMKTAIDNLNTDVDSLKSEILLSAHPVGSYYISDKATDPGTLFGGTWKMLDPGLTLISQGKGTDKFGSFEFVAGQTYGERLHQLTVDELTKHRHGENINGSGNDAWNDKFGNLVTQPSNSTGVFAGYSIKNTGAWVTGAYRVNTDYAGSNKPHNTLQPSKAVYIWTRTA